MKDASTLITYNAMRLFELWLIPAEETNTGIITPIRSFKVSNPGDCRASILLTSFSPFPPL